MLNRNTLKTKPMAATGLLLLGIVMASCLIAWDCDPSDWVGDGQQYREDFHKTFPLGPDGRFSLKNTNGTIVVETWSKAEADVTAVKIAKRHEADLKRVTIETDARDGVVMVDTVYPKFSNIRVEVNYVIKVPEGVRLETVRSTNGDVELTGRFGDVKASSTNGDIKLQGAAGAAELSTTNGSINASEISGAVDAHTTNGRITLAIAALKGDLVARTTNGSITARVSGEINAELRLHTTNGHIESALPVTIRNFSNSRRNLEGTVGSGGRLINLSTTNGSITIER